MDTPAWGLPITCRAFDPRNNWDSGETFISSHWSLLGEVNRVDDELQQGDSPNDVLQYCSGGVWTELDAVSSPPLAKRHHLHLTCGQARPESCV